MSREEAIAAIIEELADLQLRTQGAMDWEGEPDLRDIAENIYATARQAET